MDLIVAVLLWIGAVAPNETITQEVISSNADAIEYYSHDQEFLEDYNASRTADHIGMLDLNEGD